MSVQLDRTLFRQTLGVVAVRTTTQKISRIVKLLHGNLLNVPKLRNVVSDPQTTKSDAPEKSPEDCKLILLNERIRRNSDEPRMLEGIAADVHQKLIHEGVELVDFQVELSYTHFNVEQVLAKLLPKQVQVPSSFECVGHIAHLNLREAHLPFKHLIGQVILDKNPHIQTVVNKTDSIETKYRTFPMEILAGKDDFNVTVHESRAVFCFNYAEVYWNSRLQHEHARIIRLFDAKRDVVCDMMAGVGPFAIPLARKGCVVYANDLNPHSYRYLLENIKRNKVAPKLSAWNLDGRDFVQTLLKQNKRFSQVLLNLPATAIEFLDVFVGGGFDDWNDDELPWIHCYCFTSATENQYEQDVLERVERVLKGKLDRSATSFQLIRDVAPRKVMMCISFRLTSQLAHTVSRQNLTSVPKRLKTDPQHAE
uniref:tRNA (guanine(37)-N1)-methyltransferase n=1 Tax=Albugo laibachii Nc14 TaxID=890382 RepID=F0WY28_9STRA|nr:unnamed protein product [Albugo laibachii Nc14]|eukprot:CCA26377.1 unnamed protein product [Albugo laibachii Nc14]